MKSKQQLSDEKSISVDTTTKTLRSIGIDTSKSEYTDEECDRFYEARRLMDDENYTYKKVSEHFGVSDSNDPTAATTTTAHLKTAVRGQLASFDELILKETHQYIEDAIGSALENPPPIEQMIARQLEKRPQIAENIKAQFSLLSESFKANAESRRQRQVYQDNSLESKLLPETDNDEDGNFWDADSEEDNDSTS